MEASGIRVSGRALLASALAVFQLVTYALGQAAPAAVTAVYGGAPVLDFAPGLTTADFAKSLIQVPPTANPPGPGGTLQVLNAKNFPAVVGQGVATALISFNPCGQNILHSHPRATEIAYVISGKLLVGFVDTGPNTTLHLNVLNAGDVTIFPQGLMHFQQEIGNAPAVVSASFNNENPGVVSIPRTTFQFPPEIIAVAFGQTSVSPVTSFFGNLPSDLAQGSLAPGGLCQSIFSKNFLTTPPAGPYAPPNSPGAGYRKMLSEDVLGASSTGDFQSPAPNFNPAMLLSGSGAKNLNLL